MFLWFAQVATLTFMTSFPRAAAVCSLLCALHKLLKAHVHALALAVSLLMRHYRFTQYLGNESPQRTVRLMSIKHKWVTRPGYSSGCPGSERLLWKQACDELFFGEWELQVAPHTDSLCCLEHILSWQHSWSVKALPLPVQPVLSAYYFGDVVPRLLPVLSGICSCKSRLRPCGRRASGVKGIDTSQDVFTI